jgi:hypothetical protein
MSTGAEAIKCLHGIRNYIDAKDHPELDIDMIRKACVTALVVEQDSLDDPSAAQIEAKRTMVQSEPSPDNALCELLHETLQAHQECPVCKTTVASRDD